MKPIATKLEDLKYETLRTRRECEELGDEQTAKILKEIIKLFDESIQSHLPSAFDKRA